MHPRTCLILILVVGCLGFCPSDVAAQSKDNKSVTGYSTLVEKYGFSNLESGAGITCTHPENPGPYMGQSLHFDGKNFIDHFENVVESWGINSHASRAGRNFYGNYSYAPDVVDVCLIQPIDWIRLMRTDEPDSIPQTTSQVTSLSVAFNPAIRILARQFIWGDFTESFSRLDYAIEAQDVFICAGSLNVGSTRIYPNGCYNVISVRPSYATGLGAAIIPYFPERTKPDIKAPSRINVEDSHGSPSNASPMVGSAAALLYSAALGKNANKSEVIKAVLLAGATKKEFPAWSISETAPLDPRHGVGELNVFNSYEILKAGESSGGGPPVPSQGWHYGEIANGDTDEFTFSVPPDADEFSLVLIWNARVLDVDPGPEFDAVTDLTNLDLELSTQGSSGLEVWNSNSAFFNVEHIYLRNPEAGLYSLDVKNDPNGFDWDYGIAWRISKFNPQLVGDFLIVEGNQQSGQLTDIQSSDDNYLTVEADTNDVATIEFETVLPAVSPTGLKFAIESHVDSADILQTIEYYDFLRDQWFELGAASPASSSDTDVPRAFELEGEMFDYMSSLNDSDFGKVRFRVVWEAAGSPPPNWQILVDHVEWEVAH